MCVTLRQPLYNDVCQINYDRHSNGFNDTERGRFDISLKMHIKTPTLVSIKARSRYASDVVLWKYLNFSNSVVFVDRHTLFAWTFVYDLCTRRWRRTIPSVSYLVWSWKTNWKKRQQPRTRRITEIRRCSLMYSLMFRVSIRKAIRRPLLLASA